MSKAQRRRSDLQVYVLAARIGVGCALLGPMLWFLVQYWRSGAPTDQLPLVLAQGLIAGGAATIEYALTHPVAALLYLVSTWAMWVFAFGRTHRRQHRSRR